VIRTVWLTVLCLSGAGAIAAINAGTSTPPPPITAAAPEQTTTDETASRDTLTEADREEIADVRDAVAAEPAIPVAKSPDETSPQPAGPSTPPKIVNRHRHDPTPRKSAAASPERRAKGRQPTKSKNVDHEKPTVDLRPCRRPEGFAGLLRALNLTPGCDT
jgi:hypothetical protein